jgi:hypothetical protein
MMHLIRSSIRENVGRIKVAERAYRRLMAEKVEQADLFCEIVKEIKGEK